MNRVLPLVLMASLCAAGPPGCGRPASETEQARQEAARIGRLPRLRAAEHPALRRELARLEEERALPELLAAPRVPPEENAARSLKTLLDPTQGRHLSQAVTRLLPGGRLPLAGVPLERARGLLRTYAGELAAARRAWDLPRCDFELRPIEGPAMDLSFLPGVKGLVRLEALAAADLLAADRPGDAVPPVARMLRAARLLGREKHVVLRIEAAHLRRQALAALEAVARHPGCGAGDLSRLAEAVHETLRQWPPDADCWIAERAAGLHCFETAHGGDLAAALAAVELAAVERSGRLQRLAARSAAEIESDLLVYLDAMRRLIGVCHLPYFARRPVLDQVQAEVEAAAGREDSAWLARHLLADVRWGMELQAQDRADCERWALALAEAAGAERPALVGAVDPLLGRAYQVARQGGQVRVGPLPGQPADRRAVAIPVRRR